MCARELGVENRALSFVQKPEDLERARALVGERAGLLARLEKPQAVQDLAAMLAL